MRILGSVRSRFRKVDTAIRFYGKRVKKTEVFNDGDKWYVIWSHNDRKYYKHEDSPLELEAFAINGDCNSCEELPARFRGEKRRRGSRVELASRRAGVALVVRSPIRASFVLRGAHWFGGVFALVIPWELTA